MFWWSAVIVSSLTQTDGTQECQLDAFGVVAQTSLCLSVHSYPSFAWTSQRNLQLIPSAPLPVLPGTVSDSLPVKLPKSQTSETSVLSPALTTNHMPCRFSLLNIFCA